jgi:hypothetical protein
MLFDATTKHVHMYNSTMLSLHPKWAENLALVIFVAPGRCHVTEISLAGDAVLLTLRARICKCDQVCQRLSRLS